MSKYLFLIHLVVYIAVICLLTKYAYRFFTEQGWLRPNYVGKDVVYSFGLLLGLHYLLYLLFIFSFSALGSLYINLHVIIFSMGFLLITLIGCVDDFYGNNEIKGFRGHFKVFFKDGQLTTGFLKALLGSLVALLGTYFFSVHLFQWFVHTLLVIFSMHIFNLLDVRPGRALKSFWFLTLLILPFNPMLISTVYFLPVFLSTLIIFPYERKCLTMLGDAGSNVLGYVFGFYLILLAHLALQAFFLVLFVLLSLIAEKYSFSQYINKTPWLSKLDNWGIYKLAMKD